MLDLDLLYVKAQQRELWHEAAKHALVRSLTVARPPWRERWLRHFKQFLTAKASAVAIYGAPAHHKIAGAKAPARAMLFICAGETVFKTIEATQRCPAGTAILVDAGSGDGLTETAGPEGYTAIKVQLAD